MQNDKAHSKKKPAIIILVIVALLVAVLTSVPTFQNFARQLFGHNQRAVLAKIEGFFGSDSHQYLILKIRDQSGILIEIYLKDPLDGRQSFKQNLILAQDSDAYITIDKNTTNLALSDVDKDGQMDILAPSVDRNGNLRLNAYRYNEELKIFEALQENLNY